jgi:HTH-type transcriptional regulator, sugar sensing transcriptional regulator
MERHELLLALERFGLTDREAVLYLSLLMDGPATAPRLARSAETDRVVVYRTLDTLRARGVVRVTAERPRRYIAIPPRALFDQSLEGKRVALAEDERIADTLAETLPTLAARQETDAPRFQILPGAKGIYPHLREMIRRAQTDLAVMITHRGLRSSSEYHLQDELPRFLRAGGRFRMLVESDPRVRTQLVAYNRLRTTYPTFEIRQLYPQPARVTIVDREEVLVFPVPDGHAKGAEEVALWTDNPDFIRSQSLYFDGMWERAGPTAWRTPPSGRAR